MLTSSVIVCHRAIAPFLRSPIAAAKVSRPCDPSRRMVDAPWRGRVGGVRLPDLANERLIGSVRRECDDHIIVLGERYLRHVLLSYMQYYHEVRTHLSLDKDAPAPRSVQRAGHILCLSDLRWIASPICPDLIYDRHSRPIRFIRIPPGSRADSPD